METKNENMMRAGVDHDEAVAWLFPPVVAAHFAHCGHRLVGSVRFFTGGRSDADLDAVASVTLSCPGCELRLTVPVRVFADARDGRGRRVTTIAACENWLAFWLDLEVQVDGVDWDAFSYI